jgi:2'-5' RNA ligase
MVVFIAIELEQEVKEKIHEYVREVVKPACSGGRWVDKNNYHLTLKYIGEADEMDIDELHRLLRDAAGSSGGFRLTTGSVGVFGDLRDGRARVLWLDVTGDTKALSYLRRYIENRAVAAGFKAEKRFSPHITLARDVVLSGMPEGMEKMKPKVIKVTSISLMESRQEKGRRIYLPLAVYKLG